MGQVLVIYGVIQKLLLSSGIQTTQQLAIVNQKKVKKNDIPKYVVFAIINYYNEALTRSRSSLPGLK